MHIAATLALVVSALSGAILDGHADLAAQLVTTATLSGQVRDERHADVDGALVRVVNASTGYALQTTTRAGRFTVPGLLIGGPYSVTIEVVGYHTTRRDSIVLGLGEQLHLDFALLPAATVLDTLFVAGTETPQRGFARNGIGTAISDSALRRLPAIDRDLYDFVRLTPQISARSGRAGLSGGGVGVRFNNFLVDGVSERGLLGNFAAGTGQGAKAISIEAVREYQVLLSPYDVRYGDFAGALVNAVTRSGTNAVHGTAFAYVRNDELARGTTLLRTSPYERAQFGVAVGGPIIRSRAHFFVASEFQRLTAPARGPFMGQGPSGPVGLPAAAADVNRFAVLVRSYGIDPGSAGPIEIGTPLVNIFGRIDIGWPDRRSRLVLWNNYSNTHNRIFSRGNSTSLLTRGDAFQFSSAAYTSSVVKEVAAAQLFTHLGAGGLNEFLIAFKSQRQHATPGERAPLISVAVPREGTAGGTVWLQAGSDEAAHGISVQQTSIEVADHVLLPLGSQHRGALGARIELLQLSGRGLPGAYGSWEFASLDALRSGQAVRYRLVQDARGRQPQSATHYSLYASDEWRPTPRLMVLAGVRADLLARSGQRPYNAAVDSLFGRRTSDFARALFHLSPRIGMEWDVTGTGQSLLRGGAGVFVGRPPMGWLGSGFRNYGAGTRELLCAAEATPLFVPDYRHQPTACTNGGVSPEGPVNLESGSLRMAETFRASLAIDRVFPGSVVATIEAMYTRMLSDFAFVNLNLAGPRGTDGHGRVMYGTIAASGIARPDSVTTRFPEVIDLQNHSQNHSAQIAVRLEKKFSDGLEANVSYAYSRVRDVQTPPDGFQALENWRRGRVESGAHKTMHADVSALDIPHHLVLAATLRAPWGRWATDLSFYYVGESGAPFTYLASAGGRGDLNADGTNLNDPIYVPRTTSDPAEIIFDGTAAEIAGQQAELEQFIDATACLRRQRGRIMARNSCRAPWVHITSASIRQSIPVIRTHTVALQVDIFNVLNLLNEEWGLLRVVNPGPNPPLLQHIGQTAESTGSPQPVFRFNPSRARFDSRNMESAFQIQVGLRYSF